MSEGEGDNSFFLGLKWFRLGISLKTGLCARPYKLVILGNAPTVPIFFKIMWPDDTSAAFSLLGCLWLPTFMLTLPTYMLTLFDQS